MQFDASVDRCVIVINQDLPLGLAINAASIVGIGIGNKIKQLIGQDLISVDGVDYPGVISSSLPILKTTNEMIKKIQNDCSKLEEVYFLPFSLIAQSCKNYDDYAKKLTSTQDQDIQIAAIGLVGKKSKVNKLTGNLLLFK